MIIRYSRFRTLLCAFMLGLVAVKLAAQFDEIPVDVPKVTSETPIIIRLCPELGSGQGYVESGYPYFSKEKAMNCMPGGGGG